MKIHSFERIVRDERAALRYLSSVCKKHGRLRCPSCDEYKLYKIEGGRRLRCAACGYTFHLLTRRWLNRVKIDARDWLWIIKLFELETRPSVIAAETGISYPTVLKALNTIRVSLAAFNAKDSRDARARGSRAAPPVLGVLKDENGSILTVPVPRDLIIVHMKIDGGRLILADRTISYAWLLVHDQRVKAVDAGKNFARCRVYCSRRGFWQYAKERLIKHHGVSHGRLMLYLNEIDFRWANRDDSIFDLLTERLCGFAPAGRSYADGARMAV